MKVCIDAGHSSFTAGKQSPDGTYKEAEFNLYVANRIKNHLERCGFEVVLTRECKHDVSLSDRCFTANQAQANVFVSIHTNASGDEWSEANGWEVCILAKGGQAEKLAECIREESKVLGLTDRGVKVANYQVLRDTHMPAVLIEHGFHTNKAEVELLKSATFREKCAEADAKGICKYFNVAYVAPPKSISIQELKAMGYANIQI